MAEVKITVTVEDKTSGAISTIVQSTDTAASRTKSIFDGLKKHWLAVTGAMVSAWMAFQKGLDYAKMGAAAFQAEEAFKHVTRAYGEDADALLAKMKQVSNGIIDDSDLMQRAIKALQQGLSGNQIVSLLEVARSSARVAGIGVAEAFDRITEATANQMTRGLKALGIVIDQNKAYADYAKKIGVAKEALTEMQQSQALANAAIEEGRRQMEAMGGITENTSEKIQRTEAQVHEIKEAIGKGLTVVVEEAAEYFKSLDKAMQNTFDSDNATRWAYRTGQDIRDVIASVTTLSMFLDKIGGTMTAIGHIALGGNLTELGRQMLIWNEQFEERYKDSERYLNALGDRAIQAAANVGKESQAAGNKIAGMALAQQNLANKTENARRTLESQKETLKSLYQTLAGDFSKVFGELTKKQQELFNIKLTTGDLVSQVKQTLMDPVKKYTEQTEQLMNKEKMAMKLSSDEKIKLLQSVQQQWTSMTGEIKDGDKVWKTAEETSESAIANIQRIGRALEAEKGKQIQQTQSLLEQLRSEYDKLKALENDVLTLKIDTSEFMSKIAASQAAVQALHDKAEGVNRMNIAITASGSETLPISEKVAQVQELLGSLAGETTYNLDLSAFTSAISLLYSISRERALWEYAGKADSKWMDTAIGLLEKALSATVGKAAAVEGSYSSGTSYVPKTGLYKLHQGEQVISAREAANSDNRSYRSVKVSLPSIQIIARDSDDPKTLARKIAKPLQQELKRLETYI